MTTMSSKFFQGHGASSSSIEADYLRLSVDSAHCLSQLVSKGLQLSERQCQDLSSKLVQTVENIQKLVPPSGALKEVVGNSQFDEEASPPSNDSSEDRPSLILSKLEPKKVLVSSPYWTTGETSKVNTVCKEAKANPTLFPYNELRVATRDFHKDGKRGETVFGVLYKGMLRNGSWVAVNKPEPGGFTMCHLLTEVLFSTVVRHRNVLILKGCCLHDQQYLRVYEYMENFDVSQLLLDKGPRRQIVTWPVRLKICLGVAEGLYYLHAQARPRIIHRNITARTVFLDKNFDPKIGGFSFASVFPEGRSHISGTPVVGTRGYIAPEYEKLEELSDKADVYSFGVLCLEIISGRHNIERTLPRDQVYIREWAWRLHEEDRLLELVDPTLHLTDVEVGDVQRVIKLCLMCLQNEAKSRPSMRHIVFTLPRDTEWDG